MNNLTYVNTAPHIINLNCDETADTFHNLIIFKNRFSPLNSEFCVMMKSIFREVSGRFYWCNGSDVLFYKSSWRNDQFRGKGKQKYKHRTVLKGNFSKGSKHGFGCLVSNIGYIYNGDWVSGRQAGAAEIKFKNGNGYIGQALNGLRHGLGKTLITATGDTVTCHWEQDTIDGSKYNKSLHGLSVALLNFIWVLSSV